MSENVKVKELPKMEDSEFKQCGNCIHLGNMADIKDKNKIVCSAFRTYVQVSQQLQENHPNVEWESVMADPALVCKDFIPRIGMIQNKDLV